MSDDRKRARVEELLLDLYDLLAPRGLTGELTVSMHGASGALRKWDFGVHNIEVKGREITAGKR